MNYIDKIIHMDVSEMMLIRGTCQKGFSKEEATELMENSKKLLENFEEENKDILNTHDYLLSEVAKWHIYIKELQYMVGKYYYHKYDDYYIHVSNCGSGLYFSGRLVFKDYNNYIKCENRSIKIYNVDALKEISEEEFNKIWDRTKKNYKNRI